MDAILAYTIADSEGSILMPRGVALVVSVYVVEPDLLLRRPQISRTYFLESLEDTRVAFLHRLHSIGRKRHAGAYFSKLCCLLINGDRDLALVQGNG